MKNVFVFPGQGAQSTGIIKSLKTYGQRYYKQKFEIISEAVNFDISDFISNATPQMLSRTEYTQIVMFAADIGYLSVMKGLGLSADVVAGHSVGQYAALFEAGCFGLYEVSRLIKQRAVLMSKLSTKGCLCAVRSPFPINTEEIEYICEMLSRREDSYIDVALYNSDKQIVVGGTEIALKRFMEQMRRAHNECTVVLLSVGQAFHTKLMDGMISRFSEILDKINIMSPKIPVILNISGNYYNGEDLIIELTEHCRKPVQWARTMDRILEIEEKTIFEVGPGHILSGFFRNVDKNNKVILAEDGRSVMNLMKRQKIISGVR